MDTPQRTFNNKVGEYDGAARAISYTSTQSELLTILFLQLSNKKIKLRF